MSVSEDSCLTVSDNYLTYSTNKSWVELCEEEDEDFARLNLPEIERKNEDKTDKTGQNDVKDVAATNGNGFFSEISKDKEELVTTSTINVTEEILETPNTDDSENFKTPTKIENPLQNVKLTYSDILKKYSNATKESEISEKDIIPDKKNTEFLQDDISLTGHLDARCNLFSPIKQKADPCSQKRKLDLVEVSTDEAIMPSPSKMRKFTASKADDMVISRKRQRESSSSYSETKTSVNREEETDPETLARRQKQIDYGKNTIGYERYRQIVPIASRKKEHPRTPPMNYKFSRRAWDGLIKAWRLRLHEWDPPNEEGHEVLSSPQSLKGLEGYTSDVASTDGSLPSTPVQVMKRQKLKTPNVTPKSVIAGRLMKKALGNADTLHSEDNNFDDEFVPLLPEV